MALLATNVVFAGWWSKVYHPIESAMGSQRGMLQVATIGMVLALFIIWWRR
jgi:hypothetical protein